MESREGGMQNASIFSELNGLIFEYLNISGMSSTLTSFVAECQQKSLVFPPQEVAPSSNFTQADAEELLASFDHGLLDKFEEKWTHFLSHIQLTSDDMKKLEVYLRVYFGIWPNGHGGSEVDRVKAMARLKNYFEQNSAELSNDPTILPLFALPFVNDPKSHPVFKELLEDVWSERLRAQLEATLAKYFELLQENIEHHSKLAAMVLKGRSGQSDRPATVVNPDSIIQYHQDRFFQLITTYRKVRKLLRGTRESYGKLLKVSNELILGLEEATTEAGVTIDPTLERCFIIFPELFTPDLDGRGKPDKEYFKKLTGAAFLNNILDSDVSLFFIGISDLGPESLNYLKIKDTLVSDQVNQSRKLCLLQALRWLLTKTFPKCRQHAMEAYIVADLLGLRSTNKEYRNKLFACMLTSTPTYLKECFARFLNAFASVKSGRSYLALNTHTLDTLVTSLVTCKGENESYICQMVIATLQKLSLRKEMRLGMIQRKVIQWLGLYLKAELVRRQAPRFLDNANSEVSYNPYLMEYGWALLMNLCLHEEARPVSSAYAGDILTSVVHMLMVKPGPDVAPYVVSTLYSLLGNPDVFTMAKRMKLQETLATIIGNNKTEMDHHLRKLVKVLNLTGYDRIAATAEVDYDDDDEADPEEFEAELEVTEAWAMSLDKMNYVGDDLLVREFLIQREIVLPETPLPSKNASYGVYHRPITPKSTTTPTIPIIKGPLAIKSSRDFTSFARSEMTTTPAPAQGGAKESKQNPTNGKGGNKQSTDPNAPKLGVGKASAQTPAPLSKGKVHTSTNTSSTQFSNKKQAQFERLPNSVERQTGIVNRSALMNMVKGNYPDFDSKMFSDDVFGTLAPNPTPRSKDTLGRMMSLGELRQDPPPSTGSSEMNK